MWDKDILIYCVMNGVVPHVWWQFGVCEGASCGIDNCVVEPFCFSIHLGMMGHSGRLIYVICVHEHCYIPRSVLAGIVAVESCGVFSELVV